MDYKKRYLSWLESDYFDQKTLDELKNISQDESEIQERFYKDLEFGTGGLRGIIGAGTNRMNKYTIRKATQGLADYINANVPSESQRKVAIAYDSRLYSEIFAREAALVLNANGIKTFLFDELRPTPLLSFAVRFLKCCAGIVITASHNPKEYNGYKVYWSDGAQVVPPVDLGIVKCVSQVESFDQVKLIDETEAVSRGLFNVVGKEVDDAYISEIKTQCMNTTQHDLKIVYTPLNGSGNKLVRRVLKEIGFENLYVVKDQELPDSEFKTIGVPNPEYPQAFSLALELAKQKDADIVLATDPDSDRIGVVVRSDGEYKFLTGNMTGILLTEYICSQKKALGKMPENPVIISTIVSTKLTKLIAQSYGVEYIDVLTGFKYIGEKIRQFEGEKNFLFGFEESYGYLCGTHSRDKDAVVAAMLICEMADFYKSKGLTLLDALENIYKKYGCQREVLKSIELKGINGVEKIKKIMSEFRANPPKDISGLKLKSVSDYSTGIKKLAEGREIFLTLPRSNVIIFELEDDSWICVRPSGTEPKLKIYVGAAGKDLNSTENKLKFLLDEFCKMIQ